MSLDRRSVSKKGLAPSHPSRVIEKWRLILFSVFLSASFAVATQLYPQQKKLQLFTFTDIVMEIKLFDWLLKVT